MLVSEYSLFILLLFVVVDVSSTELGKNEVTIKLKWDGGNNACKTCKSNTTFEMNYACSNGDGNFNNGNAMFQDPLEEKVKAIALVFSY